MEEVRAVLSKSPRQYFKNESEYIRFYFGILEGFLIFFSQGGLSIEKATASAFLKPEMNAKNVLTVKQGQV